MRTIAVVGGGIAGLTAAFPLSAAHDVTVFESDATAGGKIRSQQLDGFLFEWGPSGFLSNAAELNALAAELELTDAVIDARPEAKNRFIYWDGKLHKLPSKPPEMLFDVVVVGARKAARDPRACSFRAAPRPTPTTRACTRSWRAASAAKSPNASSRRHCSA